MGGLYFNIGFIGITPKRMSVGKRALGRKLFQRHHFIIIYQGMNVCWIKIEELLYLQNRCILKRFMVRVLILFRGSLFWGFKCIKYSVLRVPSQQVVSGLSGSSWTLAESCGKLRLLISKIEPLRLSPNPFFIYILSLLALKEGEAFWWDIHAKRCLKAILLTFWAKEQTIDTNV